MEIRREPFSILTVCDGNVCRSAAAQFMIAQHLPDVRVESAGVHARAGAQLCELVAREIGGTGAAAELFAGEFRSRRSDDVDVAGFDLVLTATTAIRADLARSFPTLRDRFFTLREAADVLLAVLDDAGDVARLRDRSELVPVLNRHRGAAPTTPDLPPRLRVRALDPLDIPDGHVERARRHRAVVELAIGTATSVGDSLARLTHPS